MKACKSDMSGKAVAFKEADAPEQTSMKAARKEFEVLQDSQLQSTCRISRRRSRARARRRSTAFGEQF